MKLTTFRWSLALGCLAIGSLVLLLARALDLPVDAVSLPDPGWWALAGIALGSVAILVAGRTRLAARLAEREQIQAGLSASNRALEGLILASPLPIVATDAEGKITRWSPAAERTFGWREDEVLGRYNPILPDDRDAEYRDVLARIRRGETPPPIQTVRLHRDGRPIDVMLWLGPILGADGRVTGVMGVSQDIGERLRAEADRAELLARERSARAEAEALAELSAAVASSQDPAEVLKVAVASLPRLLDADAGGIVLPGPDGVLRFEATIGDGGDVLHEYTYEPGQGYVGNTFLDGRPRRVSDIQANSAAHRPEIVARLGIRALVVAPLIAQGRTLGVIVANSRTAGAFDEAHATLLMTIAQQVATALAAAQARDDARREAAEKTAVLDQMADGVLVTDAEGRIVLANPAAGAIFGLPTSKMTGLLPSEYPWRSLTPDGDPAPPEERPILRALSGAPSAGEYRVVASDGAERRVWTSGTALRDGEGAIRGAVVVARDTTEEWRRRQQAAKGEKLRALGQLAGGVAHDLNQSLALVSGYGELALDALAGGDSGLAEARDAIGVMVKAAQDGGETVRRMLAFARTRQEGPSERVDLSELLGEVAKLTAPRWRDATRAEGRPVNLTVTAGGDVAIDGWPVALREVFTNLVFNAVDALPDGGEVRLAVERRGAEVEAVVADTGVGMSAEVQARVFEPFFSTKGERGTGLGLPSVFGIVERHGGRVTIDSAPGRGTAFRLTFPAAQADAPAAPEEARAASTVRGRVLVVDDEPQIARLAQMALAAEGHEVVLAASGEDALARLAEQPFDLVVSDVGMGEGMNGWELVERGRALYPSIHWLLATGWGATIDSDEARSRGIEAVLAKPYRVGALRALVRDTLAGTPSDATAVYASE